MPPEYILAIAIYFWAGVFGILYGLEDKSKIVVSVVPSKTPPPEAFISDEEE